MRVVMSVFILATATAVTGAQRDSAPRNDLPQPYRTTRDWGAAATFREAECSWN